MNWRNLNEPRRFEKSVSKGLFGGGSAGKRAGRAAAAGQAAATAENRRQFDLTRKDVAAARAELQPFREAGLGALDQQQSILGLQGADAQQASFDAFQDSPGQAFLRERGEKALLRNQSAIGGLGGGNIRSALNQQGIGFANQQFGDFQNRLAGLAGGSQTATNQRGQLTTQGAQIGSNISGRIGQSLAGAGQARSSGILAEQQGNASAAGNILGLGATAATGGFGAGIAGLFSSDERLKENIVKVGELDSGLNIYTWTWNDKGKEIAGNQPCFGVIAQEAQIPFPDAVETVNGFLHVNYAGIK
jgi:hypothetical protein